MGKAENGRGNGPDWTDTTVYMKEMEKLYKVACTVVILPAGRSNDLRLRVEVLASWPSLGEPGATEAAGSWGYFPAPDGVTMPALVYRLCHKLDHALTSERFHQTELPV